MRFAVGDMVVRKCGDGSSRPFVIDPPYGEIFTVAEIWEGPGGQAIALAEWPVPADSKYDGGLFSDCFRRASPKQIRKIKIRKFLAQPSERKILESA